MGVEEKLSMARQLARLGVDVIEAGFPAASDGDFEAVKLVASEIVGPQIAALARTSKQDIDRAWSAICHAKSPRLHIFIATSDLHIEKKLGKSREEVFKDACEAVRYAKTLTDNIEFSAEDATRSDPSYLAEVVRGVLEMGAKVINIPDTVGYTVPHEYERLISFLIQNVPELKGKAILSVHCHNDLGLAVANSIAAVRAGARQVECTINGIGERAGNASLEEIVMAFRTRPDELPFVTNIVTEQIYPTSRCWCQLPVSLFSPTKLSWAITPSRMRRASIRTAF
jgi:2-isopropylmalate synthase